jgi:hypothetical protein
MIIPMLQVYDKQDVNGKTHSGKKIRFHHEDTKTRRRKGCDLRASVTNIPDSPSSLYLRVFVVKFSASLLLF